MKCYKDKDGNVVHIGEWAYGDEENHRPLPDGYIECDEDVTINDDGSRIASVDHVSARKQEYPSIVDQLDYIYHNGIARWKSDLIEPIKKRNPKA